MSDIIPDQLYPFSVAAKLIPSARGGHVSLSTLHTWRKTKRLKAECRKTPKLRYWFVRGAEIIRLQGAPALPDIQSPAARRRSREEARAYLREQGVID